MKRALLLAVSTSVVLGLAGAAHASGEDVWKRLHRPLHIPRIDTGASCPATTRAALAGKVVQPRIEGADSLLLNVDFPARRTSSYYGSPWSAAKVVWKVRGSYRGPLLIRGRQLDGSSVVRFERGQIPATERRIQRVSSTSGALRLYPSMTRIQKPGCYAFQVDGVGFSRVVVFEARATGPANGQEVVDELRARGLPMEPSGTFRSVAFDYFVGGLMGQRFQNPGGEIILWQFPTYDSLHQLLIVGGGRYLRVGYVESSIFCLVDPGSDQPCSYIDVPPPHWYRSGTALALYLGSEAALLKTMEEILGEQFAGV